MLIRIGLILVTYALFNPAYALDGNFSVGINAIPDLMNDELDPRFEGVVDESASSIQFNYTWGSEGKGFGGFAKSTQSYFSLRHMQQVSVGETEDGWTYNENMEATIVVYGKRYFVTSEEHQGFAWGWYAGYGVSDYKGFDFFTDSQGLSVIEVSNGSDGFAAIALELIYRFDYKGFFIEPSVLLGSDEAEISFEAFPSLTIGYSF